MIGATTEPLNLFAFGGKAGNVRGSNGGGSLFRWMWLFGFWLVVIMDVLLRTSLLD